ncbi:MAG: hypothetical protein JNK82_18755 [Myxococcaceae bacterium]|nr:hypothetical protein [Myxococcaceae bacterium]
MSHLRNTTATLLLCALAACGSKPPSVEDAGTAGGEAAAGGNTAGGASTAGGSAGGGSAAGGNTAGGGSTAGGSAGGAATAGGGTAGGGASGGGSAMNVAPQLGALSPVTVAEGATAMVTLQATDANGDTLTFSLVSAPAFVALAGATLTLAPGFTHAGMHAVQVQVTDGQLVAAGTLNVTVTNVNRPPVLTPIANQSVVAGTMASLMLMATDPDGDAVTFSAQGLPAYATLAGSTLTFAPGAGVVASTLVTVTATDPSLATDSEGFTLTVTAPPNLAPTATLLAQVDAAGAGVAAGAMVTTPPRVRATVDDPEDAQVRLEAEVVLISAAFTGTATHSGTLGAEGQLTQNLTSLPPGSYKWQLRALDAAGNASPWAAFAGGATAFVVPAGPINGSVTIASDNTAVNSSNVTLDLTATATAPATLVEMCFSNDGVNFTQCAAPVTSRMWSLAPGEGLRAAYVRVRDSNDTTVVFFDDVIVDTTPPQVSSFAIDNGALASTDADVVLTWSASDALSGVKGVLASNDGTAFSATSASPASWVLANTEGLVTVTLRVMDVAGNAATATDTIIVDKTAPTLTTQVLNTGAGWTNQLTASLTVTATDGAEGSGLTELCVAGAAQAGCQPFGTGTVNVTLLSGDGPKDVVVTVKDAAGHTSPPKQASIGLDTQTPSLTSLVVNAGVAWASSATVSVATVAGDLASGLAGIRCRTDSGAFDPAVPYVTPFSYTMTGGSGMHTVSCYVVDAAGNASSPLSDGIGLDTTAPSGTVVINAGNPQYATSPMATLVLGPTDAESGVTHYCASLTGTAPASAMDVCFTPLATTGIDLGADGPKTVSVWFRDAALNVSAAPATDSITLDTTAPSVTVVGIAGGAAFTRFTATTFDHTATDTGSGLAQVCVGASSPPTPCVPWLAAAPLTLAAGDGMKTAFLRVVDAAGNPSAIVTDGITLDQTPPTLSGVLVNLLAQYTTSTAVTVTSTANDANGVPEMQLSNDGNTFAAPTAYSAGKPYTLPGGDGLKTVYVRVIDPAGNLSPVVSDGITLDATPPSLSISVNAGAAYATANPVTVALSATEGGSGLYRHCLKDAPVAGAAPATPGTADPCFTTFMASVSHALGAQGARRVYAWAQDNAGNITPSAATADIFLDTAAPSAPGPVTVTAAHRALNLSWSAASDASSGVQGYEVGVSQTSGGPYTFGAVVAALSTSLTLPNGVPWFVVVRAVDQAGNRGANGTQVSGTPRWPFAHQQRLPTANHLRGIAFRSGVNRWLVGGLDGALYSSDDGFSSFLRRDPMTDGDVNDVHVDPSGNVWVVGEGGHIARSTDDGVAFDVIENTQSPARALFDVAYAGQGTGMFPPSFHVAVGAAGTIVRASSGLLNPTPVFVPVPSGTTSDLNAVARCASAAGACASGSVLVAVGAAGTIVRSTDNGATWAAVAAPAGYAATTFNAVVALPSTSTFFVGGAAPAGQGPLLRSTNGGVSFSEVTTPSFTDLGVIHALDAVSSELWVAANVAGGLSHVTMLNGTTRTNQTFAGSTRYPRAIAARSVVEVATAGDLGQIDHTTAPPTWAVRSTGNSNTISGLSQPPPFNATMWQTGQSGWLAVTTTSGTLWSQQGAGVTAQSLTGLSMVDTNGTMAGVFGFAVGAAGTIVKTTNGGSTWALDADSGNVSALLNAVSCRSTTACIAVGNTGAALTWNGSSWVVDLTGVTRDFNAVTTYQPPAGSVRAVAVGDTGLLRTLVASTWANRPDISTASFFGVAHKSDLGGIVIAVGSGGAIYKSTNHGQDFTVRTSGTTTQLNAVANVAGTSTWYAVGLGGLALKSLDDGETWARLSTTATHALNAIAPGNTASRVSFGGVGGATLFSTTGGL